MKRISLIVPCLNEEEAIPAFKQEIDRVFKECLEGYAPELIFVDDGSTDRSLEMIKKMAEHSPEVKFISFSRNFGKEAAIYAGLEAATGDYAAVMDVDLQDPPSLLPDMLKAMLSIAIFLSAESARADLSAITKEYVFTSERLPERSVAYATAVCLPVPSLAALTLPE